MSRFSGANVIPGILGLDHVGIAVHSLENSKRFFESLFGAKEIHREINRDQNIEEVLLDMNGLIIQLLSPLSESGAIFDFLKTRGEGIQQIALKVSSLSDACLAAQSNGLRVIYEENKVGSRNSRINFLHPRDCHGILIELVEE